MITITYTLTKEDYLMYAYYVSWAQPGKKIRVIRKNLLFFSYWLGLLALSIFTNKKWNVDTRYIVAISVILFLIYILPLFLVRFEIRGVADKFYDDELNKNVFAEKTFRFSDSGFVTKDETGESNHTWASIVKKTETRGYFFLFISSVQAYLIPKKAFEGNDDIEAFRKLLLKNLSFDAEIAAHLKDK